MSGAQLVALVGAVWLAAVVALGLMLAIGELAWRDRERRRRHPRAMDVDYRRIPARRWPPERPDR